MISMLIASKDNQTIKEIKKLKETKYRKEKFIVEGFKMLQEAVNENAKIEIIVVRTGNEELIQNVNNLLKKITQKHDDVPRLIEVTENVFMQLTDVKTPQGVLAVIRKNVEDNVSNFENEKDALKECINSKQIDCLNKINTDADYILAIDGVQDPGNLGTIIRTADSANLKQIIVSKDTVDAYSPKVIRSTMGSIYRVKIVECEDLANVLNELKKRKFQIVSTSLDTQNSIYDIDYRKKVVVIGNEGNGVSKEIQDLSDYKVKIPMLGKTESLNASVATGIMIYEYVRQMCSKN